MVFYALFYAISYHNLKGYAKKRIELEIKLNENSKSYAQNSNYNTESLIRIDNKFESQQRKLDSNRLSTVEVA